MVDSDENELPSEPPPKVREGPLTMEGILGWLRVHLFTKGGSTDLGARARQGDDDGRAGPRSRATGCQRHDRGRRTREEDARDPRVRSAEAAPVS